MCEQYCQVVVTVAVPTAHVMPLTDIGDLLNDVVTPQGLHMILQYYTPHFTKRLTMTGFLLVTIINLLTHCLT